tara:strand:- start:11633 stop:12496 length:864 start_codon:yes stop_codon:yes gene_type:complete
MRLDDPKLFEFWKYNGGEIGCRFLSDGLSPAKFPQNLAVQMNSPCSIIKLAMAMDAIEKANVVAPRVLELGYMPYARQDKIHSKGDPLALKVMAKMIDSLGFEEVHILDPHSDVTQAAFTDTRVVVDPGTTWAYQFMKNKVDKPEECAIIVPDAGARKRAALWAKSVGITNFVQVDKNRDPKTGEILGFKILDNHSKDWWDTIKNVFLLDDICDKGGTFMGIMKQFLDEGIDLRERSHLYVSHGIFPDDTVDNLRKWFASVGTTNTWQEFDIQTQEKKNLFVQRWFD